MDKKLLEQLIGRLASENGGDREIYFNLLNNIAYHESKLDPSKRQDNEGPGRGLFQFEEGIHKSGITAVKRAKAYLSKNKLSVPKWVDSISKTNSLDASKLSGVQQKIIALSSLQEHPKTNIKATIKGDESISKLWSQHSGETDANIINDKIKTFDKSAADYKKIVNAKGYNKEGLAHYNTVGDVLKGEFTELKDLFSSPRDLLSFIKDEYNGKPSKKEKMFNKANSDYDVFKRKQDSINEVTNKANGGVLAQHMQEKNLNTFNGGGTHEQNPLGGIPQGVDNNGKQNKVEAGESSFNFNGVKFIFSDRIKLGKPSLNTRK